MFPDILPTKLNVPQTRPFLVPRPHLLAKLKRGLGSNASVFSGRLTLISAPAGFGKTTLVVEWINELQRTRTGSVCWLSLDEPDNVATRFFAYLAAALQTVQPAWGQALVPMTQAPELPPPQALMGSLIREMSAAQPPLPIVLVIDDFHLISERMIHDAIAFMVERQPPHFHLVVVTREDPLLPLNRWRARRQITEIRLADLRFSRQETAVFLNEIKELNLTHSDIAALELRTEGWIAGLQLAALSLAQSDDRARFVRSFTGSSRFLLDYLIEEVVRYQDDNLQQFLLQTSILSRLCPNLCNAVTRRSDSAQMLQQLVQGNLFLIPLDDGSYWFRYHRLFAELLRHRLRRLQPDTTVLHRRAGAWLENEGLYDEAIPHFLAAQAWTDAARLLLEISERMLRRGEAATLLSWLSELPPEKIEQDPRMALQYVWALILTGRLDEAAPHLERLAAQAQVIPALHGEVLVAQAFAARLQQDVGRTIALSEEALALLSLDHSALAVLTVNLGIAYWSAGQVANAERVLTEGRYAAQQSRNQYAHRIAVGFLSLVQAAQGFLPQAAELLRQVVVDSGANPTNALLHRVLGALCYEWNDLEGAAAHYQQAETLASMIGNVELLIGTCRGQTQLRQAQGDFAGAEAAISQAHQLAQKHHMSPFTLSCNAAAHVQLALANGDLATAVHWSAKIKEPADASPFFPRLNLTPARLLLAQGKKSVAAQQLAALYEQAAAAGWQWGAVELRALQALAAAKSSVAMTYLQEALELAQPAQYIRTFVDKGAAMAELLQHAAQQSVLPDYACLLSDQFHEPKATVPVVPVQQVPDPHQQLVEPLSERELEILRLLADRRTNAEMAQQLIVSVNTVKTHLRHIYGKLDVHDRKTAVARAREYKLLPQNES